MTTRSHYSAPSGKIVPTHVRLDEVTYNSLDVVGKALGLSMNAMVNEAVGEWLESPRLKQRLRIEVSEYEATIRALAGD